MTKLVFLDVDGVLVNRKSFTHRGHSGDHAIADPTCVTALNYITETTGAHLVMSSTWRLGRTLPVLRAILRDWKVTGTLIGVTPHLGTYRGQEISRWLQDCRSQVENYVVLDDDADMHPHLNRLVRTEFNAGLTMDHAIVAIRLFETLTVVL